MRTSQRSVAQACADGEARDVKYFFGTRRQEDLYCLREMRALKAAWPGKFEFIPRAFR